MVATDNASHDYNFDADDQACSCIVMTLSAVMITTDINDNYINIFVFINVRVT